MENPFDANDAGFVVLVNAENQHSLWPADIAVPAGWSVVFGGADKQACLEYVDENWHDLRPAGPRSLAAGN